MYHVDSSFDYIVTLSIIIISKIKDSDWELQFSNPKRGLKSEENDPHY